MGDVSRLSPRKPHRFETYLVSRRIGLPEIRTFHQHYTGEQLKKTLPFITREQLNISPSVLILAFLISNLLFPHNRSVTLEFRNHICSVIGIGFILECIFSIRFPFGMNSSEAELSNKTE